MDKGEYEGGRRRREDEGEEGRRWIWVTESSYRVVLGAQRGTRGARVHGAGYPCVGYPLPPLCTRGAVRCRRAVRDRGRLSGEARGEGRGRRVRVRVREGERWRHSDLPLPLSATTTTAAAACVSCRRCCLRWCERGVRCVDEQTRRVGGRGGRMGRDTRHTTHTHVRRLILTHSLTYHQDCGCCHLVYRTVPLLSHHAAAPPSCSALLCHQIHAVLPHRAAPCAVCAHSVLLRAARARQTCTINKCTRRHTRTHTRTQMRVGFGAGPTLTSASVRRARDTAPVHLCDL